MNASWFSRRWCAAAKASTRRIWKSSRGRGSTLDEDIPLDRRKNHTIEVVVDRLLIKPGIERRLEESVATATKLAGGLVTIAVVNGEDKLYSLKLACPECGTSVPQLEPRSFSFNSQYGACERCQGLGSVWMFDPDKIVVNCSKPLLSGALAEDVDLSYSKWSMESLARKHQIKLSTPFRKLSDRERTLLLEGEGGRGGLLAMLKDMHGRSRADERESLEQYMSLINCKDCGGKRLLASSLAVRVKGMSIAEFTDMPISRALLTVRSWEFGDREMQIVGRLVAEIRNRLEFLAEVGLDYLSLDRSAATLSGGEGQRIRLATQIGSKLRGVLYVLDEPSIGLHPRDNERLLNTLSRLRDMGNTVLVVEHDAETIERADYIVDLGPGAGRLGGHLVATGNPQQVARNHNSLTGQYLAGLKEIPSPDIRRAPGNKKISVIGARHHNLKSVDIEIPLGLFTVVTGVSGSGKSTLVNDILYRALAREIYGSGTHPGEYDELLGMEHIDKVIRIDQSPIGRTPRSNPATYTGLFTLIRDIYAMLPESRQRGYKPGRFSFNVKGGRCEACQGDGLKRIEMNFLPDVYVTCDVCRGRRYNHETLEVKYKGYSIADLLDATVEESAGILENIPQIATKLKTLNDVGLGYIHLGQSSTTLSGGEAQRIKLAKELSRKQTGRTFYLLDEPTTGLHFDDVRKLLDVLQRLVDLGNTVLVIEHNLDVIKTADWLIDLGPDGGEYGGRVVATGTPEQVSRVKKSYTGQALLKALHLKGELIA